MNTGSLSHLTHFYPRFKTLSGGEKAILRLTSELSKMGVKSTILTRGYSKQCDALLGSSVKIHPLRGPWDWKTGNHLIDSFLDIWLSPLQLRSIPPETDGLIFHSEASPFALWWAKKLFRTKKRCVYFCYQPPRFAYDLKKSTISGYSGIGRLLPLYAVVHRWLDKMWVKQADSIWTFSKAYAEWCKKLYNHKDIITLIPGVDCNQSSSGEPQFLRQRWNIPEETIVLLTVNKLIPRKNIDIFIDVVRWLWRHKHPVKGIIVGDGPIRSKLETIAKKKNIASHVVFTGHIPGKELPHYYAGADAYLFLEKNVPFGMTPLEASAAGTPVIAVRGGGALETVVHGQTGFLVNEKLHVPEIVEYILTIVKDKKKKTRMQMKAVEHARNFTWQRFAQLVHENFFITESEI